MSEDTANGLFGVGILMGAAVSMIAHHWIKDFWELVGIGILSTVASWVILSQGVEE